MNGTTLIIEVASEGLLGGLARVGDQITEFFAGQSDPNVTWLPLLGSPWPIFTITAFYLYFTLKLGPEMMKNRPAYNLKTPIIIYNIYQIIANLMLCVIAIWGCLLYGFSFRCQPKQPDGTFPRSLEIYCGYGYFLTRLIDYTDTIFHVLSKKFSNVSALHLIHHVGMALGTWYGALFAPGGHGIFFTTLNEIVHVIMYTYFLIAAMGPEYRKYLWWKRHLTIFQLVQFAACLIHAVQFFTIECDYPKIVPIIEIVFSITFICLFSNFYYHSYIKKGKANHAANVTTVSKKKLQ